jgi:hypothetical protein
MSLSPIEINHSAISPQPTSLREYSIQIQTDQESIDGSIQRNKVRSTNNPDGQKFAAELTWDLIQPSDYQTLNNQFVTGSGIYYHNPASKYGTLSFSGMPFIEDESEYVRGESLLSSYKVRIREI